MNKSLSNTNYWLNTIRKFMTDEMYKEFECEFGVITEEMKEYEKDYVYHTHLRFYEENEKKINPIVKEMYYGILGKFQKKEKYYDDSTFKEKIFEYIQTQPTLYDILEPEKRRQNRK